MIDTFFRAMVDFADFHNVPRNSSHARPLDGAAFMGVAERKERDKLARRHDILGAARECFFKRGFESTTVQQIADRAELSTGTIYLYFKSKEEIYISILEEGLNIMIGLFRDAIRPGAAALANLEEIVNAFVRFYNEYKEYLDIIAFMRLSRDRSSAIPDALRARVNEQVETCYGIVETEIQRGIDRGELRQVNTRQFAQILWGLLTGLVLSHEQRGEGLLETSPPPAQPELVSLIHLASALLLDGARANAGGSTPAA